MIQAQPSQTALGVAVRRAAHQLQDHAKVFDDPLAVKLLSFYTADGRSIPEPPSPSLSAFVLARSRYAEDQLASAVGRGVKQYVVLGAGLDTFAYRNPFAALHVFEVDHPATQAWKHQLLRAAGISVPPSLTFVPVDFEKRTLAEGLEAGGFKKEAPAFFSWLGVTQYLTRESMLAILRWITTACRHNGVVFDYAKPRESLSIEAQKAFDSLASRVAAAGEPFVGFFDPAELERDLRGLGFAYVEDLDAGRINDRYFTDRSDGLRVNGTLAGLICARGQ